MKKIIFILSIILILLFMFTAYTYADIGDDVAGGIDTALVTIKKIINPVATVAVMGCAIYLVLGSDPSNMKKAKSWGLSILVGLVLVNLAPKIVEWASLIGK